MVATQTKKTNRTVLSDLAYALLGAGDATLERIRHLSEHSDELPDEVLARVNEAAERFRGAVDDAMEELGEKAQQTAADAGDGFEHLADRGRLLFGRLSREPDVTTAQSDLDQARQGVLGAITALRNGLTNSMGRIKAAGTLSATAADSVGDATTTVGKQIAGTRHDVPLSEHTKAQLYELATARDLEGRSSMTKDQLVKALS